MHQNVSEAKKKLYLFIRLIFPLQCFWTSWQPTPAFFKNHFHKFHGPQKFLLNLNMQLYIKRKNRPY